MFLEKFDEYFILNSSFSLLILEDVFLKIVLKILMPLLLSFSINLLSIISFSS